MRGKMRDLRGACVVITGASSGIGRAAAMAFARCGAPVTLAARREEVLREAAADCERKGGAALAVPTDVGDADAVRHLAERAITAFGKIDVWVNNAGVGAVGAFVDTPIGAHDQVVEPTCSAICMAPTPLPHFVARASGVLINNLSFGAWVPAPFAGAYSASKFGLRGLTDALRAEFALLLVFTSATSIPRSLTPRGPARGQLHRAGLEAGTAGLCTRARRCSNGCSRVAASARANGWRCRHYCTARLCRRASFDARRHGGNDEDLSRAGLTVPEYRR